MLQWLLDFWSGTERCSIQECNKEATGRSTGVPLCKSHGRIMRAAMGIKNRAGK